MPFFPFHYLGFRRNPFGSLSPREWADIVVLPPTMQETLVTGFEHLQLIGPKGCGKTTYLLALHEYFAARGEQIAYERIPEGTRRFTTRVTGLHRLLLDEAQRLNPLSRWWLLRHTKRGLKLVIASHIDLTPPFAHHNLPLTTLHVNQFTTPAHMRAVVERRIAYFAFDDPPQLTLHADAFDWLWHVNRANLRATEDILYEVFQARAGSPTGNAGPITAAELDRLNRARQDRRQTAGYT